MSEYGNCDICGVDLVFPFFEVKTWCSESISDSDEVFIFCKSCYNNEVHPKLNEVIRKLRIRKAIELIALMSNVLSGGEK